MSKDIKKLTPAELKKQSKKLDGKESVTVLIGDDVYKISVDKTFRKTKMHLVLDDIVKFINAGKSAEWLEVATPYTALLVIKHFTDLEVPDDIEEAVAMLNVLVDLEALDKIVDQLPEEEVMKIYELLAKTMKLMQENMEDAEKEALELSDAEVEELIDSDEAQG